MTHVSAETAREALRDMVTGGGGEYPQARPEMIPKRIQLSRRKGWRMPPDSLKVDRATRWGNPYPIGEMGPGPRLALNAKGAVEFFKDVLIDPGYRAQAAYPADLTALAGKNLACWCRLCEKHKDGKPFSEPCEDCAPCHADPLGRFVNQPAP